jgi:hypothetical protein
VCGLYGKVIQISSNFPPEHFSIHTILIVTLKIEAVRFSEASENISAKNDYKEKQHHQEIS